MGAFISGIGDQFFGSQPPAQQTYQPTQATQGNPNVGIGFGPAPIEQNPMDTFGGGLAGAAMNAIQSNQPAPQPMPTSGMGGGKGGQTPQDTFNQYANNVFGGGNSIYQPNFMPQGPQIGFGPAPIEQNPMDIFGLPGAQNYNRQSPIIGSMPAPQPVNRFAPPNAPGVRQQPRTAPRAGIPVQSARTLRPSTRNRLR